MAVEIAPVLGCATCASPLCPACLGCTACRTVSAGCVCPSPEFTADRVAARLVKPCRACGIPVELTAYQARNKVYLCSTCQKQQLRAYLDGAVAAARAYVSAVNAATFCAECGAQPVEWHNPEHVEMNRQGYRISSMVARGRTVRAIRAEMARCTPLCRRCHMTVDGRMRALVARMSQPREQLPPKPCSDCARPYKPLRNGRCNPCYKRGRRLHHEEAGR